MPGIRPLLFFALAALILNVAALPANADELTFGCIVGRVTDRDTGEMISAGINMPMLGSSIAVHGDYRVCNLVSGDYFFQSGAPGYLSQRHDGVDTCAHECSIIQNLQPPMPVRIGPSEEARVDFALTRGAGAHGRVTNVRGQPVRATIYAYVITSPGYGQIAQTNTDANGNYSFPTEFWGGNHYQFSVLSERYLPAMHGVDSCTRCDPRDGTRVELTRGASKRLDFQLQDRFGTVTGKVIDRFTRQPIAGAQIVSPGMPSAEAVTDADGRYTLEVERKPFRIYAGGYNYAEQIHPCLYRCDLYEVPEITLGPDGTAVIDFELSTLDLWHVTPSWSRPEGGDMARLHGGRLEDVVELRMDGTPIPFRSSHEAFVEFRLPPHAEGTVTLTVVDSAGASYDLVDGLTYWKGAGPRRIRDIETKLSLVSYESSSEVSKWGEHLYFFAKGPFGDAALWQSDGTPEGTELFELGNIQQLTPLAGVGYFTLGTTLRRSDGTGTETVRTIEGHPIRSPAYLQVVGGRLYFRAPDHQDQHWVWAIDSSGEPKKLLKVTPAEHLLQIGRIGNRVVFGADGSEEHGLWISDGTPEGTALLARHAYPRHFTELNGKSYYVAGTAWGQELMVTDGTPAGTKLVIDLEPSSGSSNPDHLTVFRSRLYFQAQSRRGVGIWSTDGTEIGTRFESPARGRILAHGSFLYSMTDAHLFRTDGVTVSRFRDVEYGELLSVAGGRIWYEEHYQSRACETDPSCTALWASDGTVSGTLRMEGLVRYGGPFPLEFRNGACFSAIAPSTGAALWCVDSSSNQPRLIRKFNEAEWFRSSDPHLFPSRSGRLYLSAFTSETGRELWVSNLTESGTVLLKDINPGTGYGIGGGILELPGGVAVFGGVTEESGQELWVTGGSPETTRPLVELRPGQEHGVNELLFTIHDRAYFMEHTGPGEPTAMWSTDGTAAGTRRVLTPAPQSPVVWRSTVVFIGNHERDACTICQWNPATEELRELWRPREVHQYSPWMNRLESVGDSIFAHMNGAGWGALYLLSDDGPSLRVSDTAVEQIVPWGSSHLLLSGAITSPLDRLWIRQYEASGISRDETIVAEPGAGYVVLAADRVFIFVGREGGSTRDLWVMDELGVRFVAHFAGWTGDAAGTPDGVIFFSNAHRGDREMWQSDGTAEGTRRAWDINPSGSSNPSQLRVIGSHLVFVAGSPEDDLEPWVVRYKPDERKRSVRSRGGQ